MSERFDFTGDELVPAYRAAVDAIEAGDLVVLPTDTVYGIAADAFKADAVQRLLDAKGRGRDMPPPVLISVVESLDALATDVPEAGRKLCEAFWPGPLTVICHAQGSLMWDLGETHGTVALRVPDHENTRELLSRTGPLAVSSANKSGQPAALDVYDAEAQLADSVAVYLDGGEVTGGQPSTIVDLTGDVPHVVRIGALSMAQIREIVPEATTDLEPDAPVEDVQAEDVPAQDEPAKDVPAQAVPAQAVPAEDVPAQDEPAKDVPAQAVPAEDVPTADGAAASNEEKQAEEPKPDESVVAGPEAGEETVVDGKAPDVRPAD
ncbi:translation factor SUA5 [Kribbella voronezhensis]|uniref:L-threonylcarbamoyladenylate synthase n=1 Tax=Kribbella voronezhensis TaxID=2512212 RepID=A0A4R7SSV0_9ACTN|nr:L-threonylcarbamoyladenylate synthase [Kribbella voronezhensis]TDU82241.1 translation factor SUA5 [Kribbella voronezhensis]